MDQETAKKLLVEGGTFVFLGVPQETQFGIDMQCWNTEEDFRGIKMIPPGLHYIHYSPVSKGTGDVSPRSGFMHYFHKKEFLVKMWDKNTEDISKEEILDESIQRLKDNLMNLDRHLAPYPYEIWQKWKLLSSQITGEGSYERKIDENSTRTETESTASYKIILTSINLNELEFSNIPAELAERLSPDCGIIRASVELMSMTDEERPRGVKPIQSTESQESNEEASTSATLDESSSGQSDAKRAKRVTRAEKEDSMLPDLKPAPGAAMRFTEIPRDKYPPGSTPEEITKHYLDQSYSLELMIAQHDEPLHIIGEVQFAYLCFLIGHSLESFEHWKNLVILMCSCDDAIHKYRTVFFHFIRTLEVQIEEMPEDFLADIVMNKNLIYKKLREFFRTAYMSKIDGRLLTMISRFQENLTAKLHWDFTGLDADEEDETPVVVTLHGGTSVDDEAD